MAHAHFETGGLGVKYDLTHQEDGLILDLGADSQDVWFGILPSPRRWLSTTRQMFVFHASRLSLALI
jgi:hypothetical protein